MSEHPDLLFRGDVADLDPTLARLIEREQERQTRNLIMIPSESYAPLAVRQALGSVLQNVYAEGYPSVRATRESEALLSDDEYQLAYYRRYSDRRFYKGVEFADIIEALAGRRAAECFATPDVPASAIRANVQPLSGSPANLGVYDAFMQPGQVLMGLDLFQGGHLTHGSEFNLSGKRYKVASYGVDPKTERLDYDQIMALALKHRPRMIVAGYTSYSWAPDWKKFRAIADAVGALLVADIAHTAGLVIGGVYPNPIGMADITVFTTHKTLGGPRGAVILTTDEDKAAKIDMAVFPGAQGGPHVNKFAAMAVAFKLAQTEQFKQLQHLTVENARALCAGFQARSLKVAYGGTDTHIVVLNVGAVKSDTHFPLRGEMAARLLDLAGIVVNKNTIPGDVKTALASSVRFGTPWVSQRGLRPADMDTIAEIVHQVVTGIKPFAYFGLAGELPRGKIDLDTLESARQRVAALTDKAGIDIELKPVGAISRPSSFVTLEIKGYRAQAFLQDMCTNNFAGLQPGQAARTYLLDRAGKLLANVAVARTSADEHGRDRYWLRVRTRDAERVRAWLSGLSDGYILFDDQDLLKKVQGPVTLAETTEADEALLDSAGQPIAEPGEAGAVLLQNYPDRFDLTKPYFVGEYCFSEFAPPPSGKIEWHWTAPAESPLKRTGLFETHKALGGKIAPFAGWEMPVWYSSVSEEHAAVRQAAGLFDVSHMGCLQVSGPNAIAFLDTVMSNYAHWIDDGQSCYGYLLDPDGQVIDDLMIYRRRADKFLVVVNASNADKDWDWLNAVNERRVIIDRRRPWAQVTAPAVLRDLKDAASGADQLRDLALQGPASLAILQACTDDARIKFALARIRRTDLIETTLGGMPLVIARTGYTGEDMGFELFVHPDQQIALWKLLLDKGRPAGLKPCGLAARDSTRTEAGLPLYGHELAGPFGLSPTEAGFQGYVKYHKPFFVGRDALLARDRQRTRELVRFRMNQKGVRRPGTGCPVVNKQGQVIGHVTSCSIDSQGYLLGLAIVEMRYNVEGTPIGIFVLPDKPQIEKAKPDLAVGDKALLHIEATVLRRFPEKRIQAVLRPTED